jgi:chromosome segregation ATPase
MKPIIRASLLALALASVFAAAPAPPGQSRKARPAPLDPAAVKAIDEMGPALVQLEASHRNLMQAVGELEGLYASLSEKAAEVAKLAAEARKAKAPGKATDKLFEATKDMQEMQMSFNLQYLMLQNKISQENRQFSMVSNIMKNKHDTAKNSINNIR